MLEAIVDPSGIDPVLTHAVAEKHAAPTLVSHEAESLPKNLTHLALYSKVGVALVRADRAENQTREIRIGMYRFSDDKGAADAVDLAPTSMHDKPKVAIAGVPDAKSAEYEPGAVDSFVAVGPLLLHVHAKGTSLSDSVSLVDRTWARQLPSARAFRPTPASDIAGLPVDREATLARAIGLGAVTEDDRRYIGVLTPPMYERRLADHTFVPIMREAGVDLMGWNLARVFRTRDETAAKRVLSQLEKTTKLTLVGAPPALEGRVICRLSAADKTNVCRMAVGRYFAQVESNDLVAVQQMASAQWVVLTRNP